MSEESEPVQIPSTEAVEVSVSGEIFADEAGKEVFSAFEKLGEELNNLTENLEHQFEDDEGDENLGDFDFKAFIAASVKGQTGQNATTDGGEAIKVAKNTAQPIEDDIIALLNEEQDQEEDGREDLLQSSPTQKGHVKRDSTGGMSIDADSIASGGSHVSKKISALINSMRIRSLSLDESSAGGAPASVAAGGVTEEWENDEDCGYTVITLSEEEFFDYEEETSARILAERREQAASGSIPPADVPRKKVAAPVPVVVTPPSEDISALPAEPSVYEPYESDVSGEIVVDLTLPTVPAESDASLSVLTPAGTDADDLQLLSPTSTEPASASTPVVTPSKAKDSSAVTSTAERSAEQAAKGSVARGSPVSHGADGAAAELAAMLTQGGFGSPSLPAAPVQGSGVTPPPVPEAAGSSRPFAAAPAPGESRRQSVGEKRRSEIMGQRKFTGVDGVHCYFNLKVIFEPYKTGFEESKDLQHPKGTIIAGRYEVHDVLGQAAFSTALQCMDLAAEEDESQWVCLKVIKNNKDFLDQSLDEIKLLQYINSCGDPDQHRVLRLIDFFYCKEHLFIVSELLKENLYEFGRFIRESNNEPYYTIPRLKRITKQVLEALVFIHSLKLIHCDIKPENIVIKSFSRCEVKLIDFGSSCFTTDHLTTYIQSRSYRAPEVIIGHPYDTRIDIWSVGAVLAELHTGYVLFQNDSVATMLSRITGILGQFPQHVLQRGKDTGKYFSLSNIVYERDDEGAFHLIFPKRTDLASRLHLPAEDPSGKLTVDEELFIDFVRQMLHLDPAQRMTAEEALEHPWLADADTVYVSEYIIQQGPPADGDDQPPLPGDYEDDESVEVSGSGEGEDEEEGEEDDDYDYEEGDEELEAAEMEEAALQYLLNAHGGSAEAMEAYLQMQLQAGFTGDDSGDDHYEDGDEGNDSEQGSGVDEAEYADLQEGGEGEGEGEDGPDSEAQAEEA